MSNSLFNNDLRYKQEGKFFTYRVGAIIVENNHVLLASNNASPYYYSVGGAVKFGETAEQAVKREVFEETGVEYEIDRLAVIHENFFFGDASANGYKCHEISLYFLMKPRGSMELDSHSICAEGEEFMNWIPIDKLDTLTAYPSFLLEYLSKTPNSIVHIVTDETE